MCFVCVTTYLRQIAFISASKALDINTIAVLALVVTIVPMGMLSDRAGGRSVLLAATGGLFVWHCRCSECCITSKTTIVPVGADHIRNTECCLLGAEHGYGGGVGAGSYPLHCSFGWVQSRSCYSRRRNANGCGLHRPIQWLRSRTCCPGNGDGGDFSCRDSAPS
jgi:hypothetical protein